jgi:hypothetical protein
MTQHKYHLDKSSKKFNCPSCDEKRFVKCIETETGQYADGQYGRCDRETKCGYFTYPNSQTAHYGYVSRAKPPVETSYIANELQLRSLSDYEKNPLVKYLVRCFSKEKVEHVIRKYQVGTSKEYDGSTVFYQIDTKMRVRTGKIMGYDEATGKRSKGGGYSNITWVHTILSLPEYNLSQCLFGLHLLNETTKRVTIVESEKTALFMSLELPQHTWMATGSLRGFKYEYLASVMNCEIIAFPDKGGYEDWQKTATALNKQGFNIAVINLLEEPQYEDGWDLIDILQYEDTK